MQDNQIITIDLPFLEFVARLGLTQRVREFLEIAKEIAQEQKKFLYLAGGQIRDFFLNRPSLDLDLVIEGEISEFVESLKKRCGVLVIFSTPFLTYKLSLPSAGLTIDLASSRGEVYEEVAALPKVYPATFREDIWRRDFTINALIYGLTPPFAERVVDLVGGLSDLKAGLLRPLHKKSFVDDPTRAFRGIRYLARLNFKESSDFREALREAKKEKAFQRLSSSRLRNELQLYIRKEDLMLLPRLLDLSKRFNLFVLSGLELDLPRVERGIKFLLELKAELSEEEKEEAFLLLLSGFKRENLKRLFFTDAQISKLLNKWQIFKEKSLELPKLSLGDRVFFLEKFPPSFLVAVAVYFEDLWEEIKIFLQRYRYVKPELTGKDLQQLGLLEGKNLGELLRFLREKRLEGSIKSKEEEIELVKEILLAQKLLF